MNTKSCRRKGIINEEVSEKKLFRLTVKIKWKQGCLFLGVVGNWLKKISYQSFYSHYNG
jgi:hypothetical protein